ncbi:RpoD/SigA family RNA polymerase sigma factor [Synechococcus elongatus IITB3]|uniref:RpoD/SigA family RNA polymerase sigma factor n=1 Tax=Synechococcus elongatus TaxID=32046 RepID=UPI0030CAADD7
MNGQERRNLNAAVERHTSDHVSWYLSSIGRIPLLTAEEEVELSRKVQLMMALLENPDAESNSENQAILKAGQKAKAKMLKANLRLVVSVAKKYQNQGLELLDLIQEGSLGLERAVEKFDPALGYKFSTYAYWWIRQSMTRAIDNHARTIRLPIHVSEKISRIKKMTRELTHQLRRLPSRAEIAEALKLPLQDVEMLLSQSTPCTSLDAQARGDDGRSFLGDLIPDPKSLEPMDAMDRHIQHEQISTWLAHLTEREQQVLQLRFGLHDGEQHTLAEIGRRLNVSRERIRQVEARALQKLRVLSQQPLCPEAC